MLSPISSVLKRMFLFISPSPLLLSLSLASDFLAEIDGHRELLRIGVSVNIRVGKSAFSVVNDEETLMKLLPTAPRQWRQPAVTMMPPLPPSQR
jgi:hypothetical protein